MFKKILTAIAIIGGMMTNASAAPAGWEREFPKADFSNFSVPIDEIQSGGPGRDGIPALFDPAMVSIADEKHLQDIEPLLSIEINGEARGYPLRYLIWHEIANDTVGGTPIAVTFCPLCNSGIVFDRRLDGQELTFGVSGKLRKSDMVMYDHQTESFWQQAVGEGIVGVQTGKLLTQLPALHLSWAEFKTRYPNALVMDEPNTRRNYGENPYVGYDGSVRPFLYSGENPPFGVPALARVVRVGTTAYLLTDLAEKGSITDNGVTLNWFGGVASALDDGQIAEGRDVGSVEVFDASGNPLPHDVMFAFSFDAFYPDGTWRVEGAN